MKGFPALYQLEYHRASSLKLLDIYAVITNQKQRSALDAGHLISYVSAWASIEET